MFVFFIAGWILYARKLDMGINHIERAWYAAVLAVWMLTEAPRLYMGYRGNVRQSVAHLFGFLALTVTSHFALMSIYIELVPRKTDVDFAIALVQLFFGILEVLLGVGLMRRLVLLNTVQFYVSLGSAEA